MPITFLMPHSIKDIEEQFLTENPLRSSLQQLKPLDDFIISLLPSQTVMTSDISKISGKNSVSNVPFTPFLERVTGHL